jgi:Transposase DDE domain
MLLPLAPTRVNDAFFQPLDGLVATSPHLYPCPEYSDADWLRLGIQRVLERVESGRAFLQEHGPRFEYQPTRTNYFAALQSERRLELARDVNRRLLAAAALPDHLAQLPELKKYQCFALDGHWHQAATHDPRHDGTKMAVGHFYSLDLRGHQLRHLTVGEGLHEHDMSVLKRIKPSGLRHDVPKGTRVLIIYDKAGIDFAYWKRCQRECAVYFISRVKEGMVYDWLDDRPLDPHDPRQRGVTADRHIMTRDGHQMRIIAYTDPATGETYEFLTNEMDLPAGVIAELYRRRWDVEKVFDQIKNKLGEKKAWGTSLVAKATQGQLVALTHNLLLRYEARLEREHGVSNAAEDQRRQARHQELKQASRRAGIPLTTLRTGLRRATQRSVKFLRWLRQALREKLTEETAVPRLTHLYASL